MRLLQAPASTDPSGLVAKVGNARADLTWLPVAGATGYQVFRGTSPTLSSPVATTSSATLSYADTGLVNGTWYTYTVLATGPQRFTNVVTLVPTANGGSYNGYAALTTPTPDGTGHVTHPDVTDFGQRPFRGFRYWCAYTPYNGTSNLVENPCVVVSNDGISWQVPPGGVNPIDPYPGGPYNSDNDMLFSNGTFYLFYRETDDSTYDKIQLRTSPDGITWSAETTLFTTGFTKVLSPAIVRLADGTWRMWAVDGVANQVTVRTSSAAASGWSAATPISIVSYAGSGINPWHLDVEVYRGRFYMLLCERTSAGNERIAGASSADGVLWTAVGRTFITGVGRWESYIYRGGMTPSLDGLRWRVWYGGVSTTNGWNMGYAEVPMSEWPALGA